MTVVFTLPVAYIDQANQINDDNDLNGVLFKERNEIGGIQIFNWIIENGEDVINILTAIINLLETVKKDGKPGKIKIDGIEYEYETEEQLKEILERHNNLEK